MIKLSIIVSPCESEDKDPTNSYGWRPTRNQGIKPKIIEKR